MSNAVDPEETRAIVIGPCRCPGTPHESDTADVVSLFGYGDRGRIRQAGRVGGPEQFKIAAIFAGVRRWNLVLRDGAARPVNLVQIERLDEWTVDRLIAELDDAFTDDPLPNASGAPSPAGSSASASPTPTPPTPQSSTTT